MVKLFTFTIILSSILIAHIICPRPPETKKPVEPEIDQPAADVDESVNKKAEETEADDGGDDDKDDVANYEEEAEPSLPFLTCTIFPNNFACNAMCSVLGSIYGTPITSGICEEAKECECQVLPKATLEDYWNEKFLAKNTLREILQDEKLSEKIREVLKTPFKTAQQTIDDLKPLLSPKQLSNLRIKNKSVQKIFSNDGKFDKVAVQKYVASKLKSLGKPSEGFDYKKTLLDVLNSPDNEDIVDYIIDEIRQSKNKLLNSVIADYVKEHGIQVQEPAIDSKRQDTIIDFLDTAVINELIKPPPRENALKLTGLRSKSSKSAAGIANKSSNKPASFAKSTNKGKLSSAGITTESNNKSDQSSENSRWILKGFDETEVSRVIKGEKCWENSNYKVRLYKGSTMVQVSWSNMNDDVHLELFTNGNIEQNFWFKDYRPDSSGHFDRVDVRIEKYSESGTQVELWEFPKTQLQVTKGADGKIHKEWGDTEDLQSLEKYKTYIEKWCAHNEYFVGKGNCLITLS